MKTNICSGGDYQIVRYQIVSCKAAQFFLHWRQNIDISSLAKNLPSKI